MKFKPQPVAVNGGVYYTTILHRLTEKCGDGLTGLTAWPLKSSNSRQFCIFYPVTTSPRSPL